MATVMAQCLYLIITKSLRSCSFPFILFKMYLWCLLWTYYGLVRIRIQNHASDIHLLLGAWSFLEELSLFWAPLFWKLLSNCPWALETHCLSRTHSYTLDLVTTVIQEQKRYWKYTEHFIFHGKACEWNYRKTWWEKETFVCFSL